MKKFTFKSVIKAHLSYKIFLILFATTVLPICISSYFTYQNSLYILQNSYINTNVRLVKQGSQNISNYLDSVNQVTLGLYKDRKFMDNVTFNEMDFSGTKYNEQVLNNILFHAMILRIFTTMSRPAKHFILSPGSFTLLKYTQSLPAVGITAVPFQKQTVCISRQKAIL